MLTDAAPSDMTRYLRLDEVQAIIPLSRASIYRRIKDEGFPAPLKMGARSLWVRAELESWLHQKVINR